MKCKRCKREITENSVFCSWCGTRQIADAKLEIKVPYPKKLQSGKYHIYLRAEGKSVTEDTEALCLAKARAVRAGFIEQQKRQPKRALQRTLLKYIQENNAVLSPSTIRGYEQMANGRFRAYADQDISSINWQKAINEESKLCSAKTVRNAWGLVSRVMRVNGIDIPDVSLPKIPARNLPWLTYEQIQIFLNAIHGESIEMAALFALHSLRRSELLAITPEKIQADGIHVAGARVHDAHGKLIEKETNKNRSSTRVVPIMIPRLKELIDASDTPRGSPYVTMWPNNIFYHINSICQKANLPKVGFHGLRRSFASLAHHLGWDDREIMAVGGWSDIHVMHQSYIRVNETDLKEAANQMREFYILQTDLQTASKN